MLQARSSALPTYGQGMYHQYQPRLPVPAVPAATRHGSQHSNYPVHPDVKLKRLPFYDLLAELIKPSTLGMLLF